MKVSLLQNYIGHQQAIYALELNNHYFYTGGGDGLLVEWDLNADDTGKVLASIGEPIYSIHFNQNTNYIYVGTANGKLHIIDLKKNVEAHHIDFRTNGIFHATKEKNRIIISGGQGNLIQYNIDERVIVSQKKLGLKSIRGFYINHDFLWIGNSEGEIHRINSRDFTIHSSNKYHDSTVFAIEYNQIKNILYSGGRDAHLLAIDLESNKVLHKVPAHTLHIHSIALSPNCLYLATSSMDKTIKIWDSNSLQLLKVIDYEKYGAHRSSVNQIKWVNHEQLLSVSDDKTAILWEIKE